MSETKQKPKTWRDLKDTPTQKKKTLTFIGILKLLFACLKYLVILILLVALGLGAYFLYKAAPLESYIYNDSQRIKSFILKKDKNITTEWLWEFSRIDASMPLDSIDIHDIKTRTEALEQVDSVKIEKIYPDTIKIEIQEKDYIAKTYNKGTLLIMSSSGDFYEPICFSQELLASLPSLSELKIDMHEGAYVPFSKARSLQNLLFLAKNNPNINFKSWHEINMKKANYLVEPLMEIHTLDGIKIIFAFDNYNEQFLKLQETLDFSKKKGLELESIDLSLKDRADLKIKEPK